MQNGCVIWYLTLRGIEYAECIQPIALPRGDLSALGVKYRRIPVLSMGRDIYCDTRLILEKLEKKFPSGALGASQPDQKAVEKLLEKWIIDGGIFSRTSQVLPLEMPLFSDPNFVKDREDYIGRSFTKEDYVKGRPEALAHLREAFQLLESTLLADGRNWVLNTPKVSLADIEAIWPFHWLSGLEGALPPSLFGKEAFPKVYAWIERFSATVKAAEDSMPKVTNLEGAEAIKSITQADFVEPGGDVDEQDPLALTKGQEVESWPTDSGSNHRDRGQLIALTRQEVVLKTQAKVGGADVHIHHPRTNFRIQPVNSDNESKL
ncbi:MAG: hypothetical protein Q9182_001054 [Xanthomendoza sp. 2 TL-2023]